MSTFQWPERVSLREVGLRDGLQSIATVLATERKLDWIEAAHAAGQREIEVGSFVPARHLPQMADTAQVLAHARTLPGLKASVLMPNLKGAERAMDSGADWMLLPLSASHAHSLANLRKTPDEVVAEIAAMVEARAARGSHIRIEVGMSTALGCTIQGEVAVEEVLRLLKAVLALGVDRVGLADTVGYADPQLVRSVFKALKAELGDKVIAAHFHDTRGTGLANVAAALECGIRHFDASLAGIGGCPFAPGATGNIVTEDLCFMLDSMGLRTGVNLEQLVAIRQIIRDTLPDIEMHGTLARAGLPVKYRTMLDPAREPLAA